MPDLNALLALALVGVYVLDSAHFLAIGDAVLVTRRQRLRAVSFGSSFELAGRRPHFPNPLTPFWPELRILWTSSLLDAREPNAATSEMLALLRLTRPISLLASVSGLFIALVGPVALAAGREVLFVVAAGVSFLFVAAACVMLTVRRRALGINWPQFVSMVFVALVCLPCAANLGRAVARHRSWTVRAADIPALGFDATAGDQNKQRVTAFLSQVRGLFPEGTSEYSALTNQLTLLERPRR